jgi:hypothetical protein
MSLLPITVRMRQAGAEATRSAIAVVSVSEANRSGAENFRFDAESVAVRSSRHVALRSLGLSTSDFDLRGRSIAKVSE